jgi:hypothetical protein
MLAGRALAAKMRQPRSGPCKRKMMSHLRHEIFNHFGVSVAWHDLVALATSSRRTGAASRDFDNVMPRETFCEITRDLWSQSRHGKRLPNGHRSKRVILSEDAGTHSTSRRQRASWVNECAGRRRDGGVLAAPLGGVATDETGPTRSQDKPMTLARARSARGPQACLGVRVW